MAGSVMKGVAGAEALLMAEEARRTNWAGNYTYKAAELAKPESATDVPELLRKAQAAKALGARHSFNNIADTPGEQITMTNTTGMTLDRAAKTATVDAGVTYGKMAPWLDAQGFAVHNLASLPHISVVGACATGTHGSGVKNGCLTTAVRAYEIVDAQGQVRHVSRDKDGDDFHAMAVGLGAFGVITRVTLDLVPSFQVAQTVYQNLSFNQLQHNLDAIFSSAYSVSLFTDWQGNRATQVWLKEKLNGTHNVEMPATFYGATRQTEKLHPLEGHSAVNCTDQMGIPGPWYERLPHFRMEFTPSSGQEIQSEFLIPRKDAYRAIRAVEELRDQITPHLFITELRTIAADDLWMSMAYQRDSLAIHFTWKPETDNVLRILPAIEAKLAPFAPRPHWAKVYTMAPEALQRQYPRYPEFKRAADAQDPAGKFRNAYLRRNLSL